MHYHAIRYRVHSQKYNYIHKRDMLVNFHLRILFVIIKFSNTNYRMYRMTNALTHA